MVPTSFRRQQGFQLLELLIVLAIVSLVALIAAPTLLRSSRSWRLEMATAELSGAMRSARSEAIRRGRNVGLKLQALPDGRYAYRLYLDGDGDGVRSRDISNGVDLPLGPSSILNLGRDVDFGLPLRRVRGLDGRVLDRLDDPVRFNRSDLASFSPLGTATPGTLYLTDHGEGLALVRLSARTGRVRVLRYDFGQERWR